MLDFLIVMFFLVYSVAAGFKAKDKASENLEEYFLAGRSIKGWKAGLSMAATQYAADTPLLVSGLIATGGIFMLRRLWVYGLAFLLMGFLLSAFWRRASVLTDAEMVELRYSGKAVFGLRMLKAIYYGTVINCTVMAMVLVAAARIAEIFLPWHQWLPAAIFQPIQRTIVALGIDVSSGTSALEQSVASSNVLISILVIVAFTTLYSTTGGLRSVIETDVVQFIFAMIATVAYAVVAIYAAGGLGTMLSKVQELYPDLAARMLSFGPVGEGGMGELLMPFLILLSLQWFFQMNSDGTGYLAQRSMACRTDREARVAAVLFSYVQVLLRSLCWLPIVVALLVIYPFSAADMAAPGFATARESLFAQGIQDLLPPGIKGIMLTGILAALASTIDTHLNWGASYWSNDIYKEALCRRLLKREPAPRELVLAARCSNLLILSVALLIMLNLSSIQSAWQISLMFGAGMGAVLVLRWIWEKVNIYAELAAMGASLVFAPLLLFAFELPEWQRLLLMALISTLVVVGTALWAPATDEKVLDGFYQRVRPLGFWNQTAARNGDLPAEICKAFWSNLGATVMSAGTLFLLLYGIGKLMIHLPGESLWLPALATLASLLLIPLWWPHVFHEADEDDDDDNQTLPVMEAELS